MNDAAYELSCRERPPAANFTPRTETYDRAVELQTGGKGEAGPGVVAYSPGSNGRRTWVTAVASGQLLLHASSVHTRTLQEDGLHNMKVDAQRLRETQLSRQEKGSFQVTQVTRPGSRRQAVRLECMASDVPLVFYVWTTPLLKKLDRVTVNSLVQGARRRCEDRVRTPATSGDRDRDVDRADTSPPLLTAVSSRRRLTDLSSKTGDVEMASERTRWKRCPWACWPKSAFRLARLIACGAFLTYPSPFMVSTGSSPQPISMAKLGEQRVPWLCWQCLSLEPMSHAT